ncbi:MAG: Hg(II)-responsive transcriptional regulator [Aquabacterium sp.]|nr:Hg(II)-responsive transcriptional regulator [Aquabacterium sp.]
MAQKLTIGKVAAAAAVNVETIRFYQRRGLLTEPPKSLGGFRYYDQATIARVRFVKRAQALGFSLEEVMGLLALEQSNACGPTHDAAVRKLQLVEERITDLKRIRSTLKNLVQQCEAGPAAVCCPIIESLAHSASIK